MTLATRGGGGDDVGFRWRLKADPTRVWRKMMPRKIQQKRDGRTGPGTARRRRTSRDASATNQGVSTSRKKSANASSRFSAFWHAANHQYQKCDRVVKIGTGMG